MVLLKDNATATDQIRSLFQAEYLRYITQSSTGGMGGDDAVLESLRYTRVTFPDVAAKLTEVGWNLTTPHLAAGEARVVDKSKVK